MTSNVEVNILVANQKKEAYADVIKHQPPYSPQTGADFDQLKFKLDELAGDSFLTPLDAKEEEPDATPLDFEDENSDAKQELPLWPSPIVPNNQTASIRCLPKYSEKRTPERDNDAPLPFNPETRIIQRPEEQFRPHPFSLDSPPPSSQQESNSSPVITRSDDSDSEKRKANKLPSLWLVAFAYGVYTRFPMIFVTTVALNTLNLSIPVVTFCFFSYSLGRIFGSYINRSEWFSIAQPLMVIISFVGITMYTYICRVPSSPLSPVLYPAGLFLSGFAEIAPVIERLLIKDLELSKVVAEDQIDKQFCIVMFCVTCGCASAYIIGSLWYEYDDFRGAYIIFCLSFYVILTGLYAQWKHHHHQVSAMTLSRDETNLRSNSEEDSAPYTDQQHFSSTLFQQTSHSNQSSNNVDIFNSNDEWPCGSSLFEIYSSGFGSVIISFFICPMALTAHGAIIVVYFQNQWDSSISFVGALMALGEMLGYFVLHQWQRNSNMSILKSIFPKRNQMGFINFCLGAATLLEAAPNKHLCSMGVIMVHTCSGLCHKFAHEIMVDWSDSSCIKLLSNYAFIAKKISTLLTCVFSCLIYFYFSPTALFYLMSLIYSTWGLLFIIFSGKEEKKRHVYYDHEDSYSREMSSHSSEQVNNNTPTTITYTDLGITQRLFTKFVRERVLCFETAKSRPLPRNSLSNHLKGIRSR